MGLRGVVLAGASAVMLLAACGGSSHKTSTTSSVVTTPPASSSASLPAVAHRLLTSSEMPAGFTANGQPSVSTGVPQWLAQSQTPAKQVAPETARLKRLGFVAGATLALNSAKGPGLSLVEQFRSPAGARSELKSQTLTFEVAPGFQKFPAPGIPGALGFGFGNGGVNVAFADGDYYYVVGEAVPSTAANQAVVIASAAKLYHRVHG